MSETESKAVFLSYASQDAAAAKRICESLRAAGVEVWFDQNELVGGDAWDAKIRRQIGTCALFVPVISAATQSRLEGYFRLEWKIAAQRTHTMADEKAFLLPVVIDATRDADATVPSEFKAVQWVRLPDADATAAFCARVRKLLELDPAKPPRAPASPPGQRDTAALNRTSGARGHRRLALARSVALVLLAAVAIHFGVRAYRFNATRTPEADKTAIAATDKSVAVLPFASLSTEKDNEFFADALHDDVITHLQKIRDLKVISRTSVLAYRDNATRNVAHIANALGVATIVEGSVRRTGSKVRVNAKLIDARNETSLWAETLDGDAGDAFALQVNLAQRIAGGLRATLTGNERTLISRRATASREAYELYQRGRLQDQELSQRARRQDYDRVVTYYEQAVAKDPGFALAYAQLAILNGRMYWFDFVDPSPERRVRAETALASAIRLAPHAPETHLAKGTIAYCLHNDWRAALAEYALAEPGLPNEAQIHLESGLAHRRLGQMAEAVTRFQRAVELDPQVSAIESLAGTLFTLRRYEQVIELASRYLALFPDALNLRRMQVEAHYARTGDRRSYSESRRAARSETGEDDLGLEYQLAMIAGDWTTAERVLADPRLTTLRALGYHREPVAIRRAMLAFLRGDHDAAKRFADDAIAYYRAQRPLPRWGPAYQLAIAEAETYAGHGDAAIQSAPAAVAGYATVDAYSATQHGEFILGRIYVILGRIEDALALLRRIMSAPGQPPQAFRDDPFWSRLKDDPRFEEILRSAKTL